MTTTTATETKQEDHRSESQARAQFESIKEAWQAYQNFPNSQEDFYDDPANEDADYDAAEEECRETMHELGLSLEKVEHIELLLCTGGPAVKAVARVGNDDGQRYIERAWMEHQDWFEPWQKYELSQTDQKLLEEFMDWHLELTAF